MMYSALALCVLCILCFLSPSCFQVFAAMHSWKISKNMHLIFFLGNDPIVFMKELNGSCISPGRYVCARDPAYASISSFLWDFSWLLRFWHKLIIGNQIVLHYFALFHNLCYYPAWFSLLGVMETGMKEFSNIF